MDFGNVVLPWTRHVRAGRDLVRRAFEAANKMGDLTYAAYCGNQLNTNLLAAGDPLAEVEREAEQGLAFAQKTRFGLVIDCIATQLGLIRTLRGLTPTFGSFDDEQFDEASDRAPFLQTIRIWRLSSAGIGSASCRRASLPATMRAAVEASSRAQRLLWTSPSHFETAEYHFYGALSRAASCDSAAAGERQQHLEALAAHHRAAPGLGGELPGQFREPRRAGRRRDRSHRRPRCRGRCASTNRPSARPAPTALFTTRRSPTNSPRASTRRVASTRLPVCICRTPATAICVGEPMARCGNSTSCIRTSGSKSQRPLRRARSGRRSNTSTSRP